MWITLLFALRGLELATSRPEPMRPIQLHYRHLRGLLRCITSLCRAMLL
jgi:hypothetical protein